MKPESLAACLAWFLDLTALGALAATTEVQPIVFGAVAAGLLISLLTRLRIGNILLLGILFTLIAGALVGWLGLHVPPILAAAHAAPLLHAAVWFMPRGMRSRTWRMVVGFAELILASALTAEFYLSFAIFAFVVVAAVMASCGFLESELRRRASDQLDSPLPRGFVLYILGTAFVVFLTSLLIFPILPRMRIDSGMGSELARIGYTEDVTLIENLKFSDAPGSGTPVLWLYPRQPGEDLSLDIRLGLIRGKALDAFDGGHWSSAARQEPSPRILRLRDPRELSSAMEIDVVRGPLLSHALPVPYGTLEARSPSDGSFFRRLRGGEWLDQQGSLDQISYAVRFVPYDANPYQASEDGVPSKLNTWIPPALRTERMQRLARSIFGDARAERDKIDRLTEFFRKDHFQASLNETADSDPSPFSNPLVRRMHPLERFLFIGRQGHCEWFASASAVLLRFAGVPTRLVAGFRITHAPVGGVLTVRSTDAHAWVEAWQEGRGWIPYDPTPRLALPNGWFSAFRNGYDWISGYWYRYILSFRYSSQADRLRPAASAVNSRLQIWSRGVRASIRDNARLLVLWLLGIVFLFGGAYLWLRWKFPWIFSIRHRVREGIPPLRRERIRMELWISSHVPEADRGISQISHAIAYFERHGHPRAASKLREWDAAYQRLRFGKAEISPAEIESLSGYRLELSDGSLSD